MYSKSIKEKIKADLKQTLTGHRYRHVLGVAKAARWLAERNGCDPDEAETAGLLHDAAKQLPLTEMQALARKAFGSSLDETIMMTPGLLHGYAAVTVAKEQYGLTDETFLAALAHHTTGAEHMGTLEKIVFVADYIEENRDFDGVDRLRQLAAENLDQAVLAGYDSTISHLLEQDKLIYIGTVVNRNAQILSMQSLGVK